MRSRKPVAIVILAMVVSVTALASCGHGSDGTTRTAATEAGSDTTATTVLVGQYDAIDDAAELVRRSEVVAEFEVVSVGRGATSVDLPDERDVLAVAVLHPIEVLAGSPGAKDLRVSVGAWTSNPKRPDGAEVLETTGWTFRPGDRVIAGVKPIRFENTYGFASPDGYFVVDGSDLSDEQFRNRSVLRQTGLVAASERLSANELKAEIRTAATSD